jgi:hypothetical protein
MHWYGCQGDAAVLLLRRCRSKEQGQTEEVDDAQNRRMHVALLWDCAMAASTVTEVLAVALRKAWDGIRLSLFLQPFLHLVRVFSRSLRKGKSCPGVHAGWQKNALPLITLSIMQLLEIKLSSTPSVDMQLFKTLSRACTFM